MKKIVQKIRKARPRAIIAALAIIFLIAVAFYAGSWMQAHYPGYCTCNPGLCY